MGGGGTRSARVAARCLARRPARAELPPGALEQEPRIHFDSRASWRAWLEEHHTAASGVWLVSRKAKTGRPTISYEAAVEEALCFGWIDGRTGRVDDERTMVRFSPRRPGSVWARSNRERVAWLEVAGLMTEAGRLAVEAARADGSWTRLESAEEMLVPDDLASALAERPGAREHFDAYSPSARKGVLGWIALAKRPETRASRIARAADAASRGDRPATIPQRGD
jgi:uncharacterized protein YdeI (YjbR/CyaY-like superfamily)